MEEFKKLVINGKEYEVKDEVARKLIAEIEGGDEHYKSSVVEGQDDAPVLTMSNGVVETVTPKLNWYPIDAYNFGEFSTGSLGTSPKYYLRREGNYTPNVSYQSFDNWNEIRPMEYDSSKNELYVNDSSTYINIPGEIWVNGTTKLFENGYFVSGVRIKLYDDNTGEGDYIQCINGNYDYQNLIWANIQYVDNIDVTPYEQFTYNTIDNAMEVEFRGQKYHLIPKENLKTINGTSIIGTGNITVSDATTKNYSGGSVTSGDYYRIQGSIITGWNDAKTSVGNYDSYVRGHFGYDMYQSEPTSATKKVLVKNYAKVLGDIDIANTFANYAQGGTSLEDTKPMFIKDIKYKSTGNTSYFIYNTTYSYYSYITVDNTLLFDTDAYNNWSHYEIEIYESDTRDGKYLPLVPTDKYSEYNKLEVKAGKYYKFLFRNFNTGQYEQTDLSYVLGDFLYGYSAEVIVEDYSYQNTDIDNALYFQNGTEYTPILTERNYKNYVKKMELDYDDETDTLTISL